MNRFERVNGNWYWRGANDRLIDAFSRDGMLNDPLFLEFIRPENEQLAQYLFMLGNIEELFDDDDILVVYYYNPTTHATLPEIRVNMATGEKTIVCELYSERYWEPLDECIRGDYYGKYFNEWAAIKNQRERYHALVAENAKLTAEIAALRAENTELKYRPGGPGYDEAAKHFAALAN